MLERMRLSKSLWRVVLYEILFQMQIRIVLHVVDEDLLLFAGPSAICPPIPKAGDEIIHEQRRVRLEGIRSAAAMKTVY